MRTPRRQELSPNTGLVSRGNLQKEDRLTQSRLSLVLTLEERIYVEKFAHHNSTISLWLKKAHSFRRNGTKNDGSIDDLLQSFGIDGLDKENHFNPNEDDISDWFGGAPGWLRRS